nr:MAG TPA: hypothetical protein [Caudoviricetes sp.]
MNKIILEALTAKFEGVNAEILTRVADKLATKATTEEEAKALAEGVSFQDLLDRYADYRVQQASSKQPKPAPQEPKPNDLKPTPTPQEPKQPNEPSDVLPEWAKELKAELESYKAQEANAKRLGKLKDILKELPESLRGRYERDFSRLTFKDDEDFTQWVEELTPDVSSILEDYKKMGGSVTNPKGGGGNQEPTISAELQKKIDEAKAQQGANNPVKGLSK